MVGGKLSRTHSLGPELIQLYLVLKLTVYGLNFLSIVPTKFEIVVLIVAAVDGVHDRVRPAEVNLKESG